jgi:hypothetical protein
MTTEFLKTNKSYDVNYILSCSEEHLPQFSNTAQIYAVKGVERALNELGLKSTDLNQNLAARVQHYPNLRFRRALLIAICLLALNYQDPIAGLLDIKSPLINLLEETMMRGYKPSQQKRASIFIRLELLAYLEDLQHYFAEQKRLAPKTLPAGMAAEQDQLY